MSSKKHAAKSGNKKVGSMRPLKSLGQNFLTDEEVIEAIVEGSGVDGGSLVIEIGPGTGVLTCPLAERAARLVAVELDERMIEPLRVKTFEYGNTEILNADILKTDLNEIIDRECADYDITNVRIVGNLPYYITTPIIMKLLEEGVRAESITVMMQKEVGDRIAAAPGTKNSGAITYAVHYYADVSRVTDAGRECFYPVPKVDSVVLRMDILKERPVSVDNEELFFRCIKAGFTQRRKTLLNSLNLLEEYDKESIAGALAAAGIDPVRRAESLTMEEFAALSNALREA